MDKTNAARQARWRQRQRELIERARAKLADAGGSSAAEERERVNARNASLEREIAARGRELRQQQPGKANPSKAPVDPDSEVVALKKANRELRAKINNLMQWHEAEMLSQGKMPLETHRAVLMCLHPDRSPTEEERAMACRLYNAWRGSLRGAEAAA
jgi:hypothetical protein